MKRKIVLALAAALALAPAARAAEVKLDTDEQKTLYALGALLSQTLGTFRLSPEELETVKAGFADGAAGKSKVTDANSFRPKLGALQQQRAKLVADDNKKAGKAFLDKVAAEDKELKKTGTGLLMKTVTVGTGESPKPTDTIKVHYRGVLIDGTEFDSSYKTNSPATFRLNQMVPCWTEAFQFMKVGGKAKLYCPSDIAYGDQGRPGIPPGATLVFDVELLDIVK